MVCFLGKWEVFEFGVFDVKCIFLSKRSHIWTHPMMARSMDQSKVSGLEERPTYVYSLKIQSLACLILFNAIL